MINRVEVVIEFVIFLKVSYLMSCSFQFVKQHQVLLPTQLTKLALKGIFDFSLFFLIAITFPLEQRSNRFLLIKAMDLRDISFSNPRSVLTHIPILFLANIPLIGTNVDEVNVLAGVGDITSDCHRVKQTVLNVNVLQGNVAKGDPWLCCTGAFPIKRIEHTARPVSIGLLHLLRPDVDSPPDRSFHCEVVVIYILNQTCSLVSRICLHIYPLQRFLDVDISEGDVANAIAPNIRGHAADAHAHPEDNPCIFYKHILGAIATHVPLVAGLRDNNIIIVLNGDVVDVHSSATGVDAIGVEGEQWKYSFE